MIKNFDVRMFFSRVRGRLGERLTRIVAAAIGEAGGYGAKKEAAEAAGVSQTVVQDGLDDLDKPELEPKADGSCRQRKPGAGRKSALVKYPNLREEVEKLVEPDVRGDPEAPLRWVSKSLRHLAEALARVGIKISHVTLRAVLREMGYTLQSDKKSHEGGSSPSRDEQFQHISKTVREFQSSGDPAVSVDAKKKELVGNFKNGGREFHRAGQAPKVEVYDFVNENGRATPYGVYDLSANDGFVNVGISHDTAEFAVDSIRRWWKMMGIRKYPNARRLYITADGGGSNGSRNRLWKVELQRLANETGLTIYVSHFPPGTSKWNKIEHRLFSFISMNWRGRPLETLAVIVSLIGATTNKSGLKVKAVASRKRYRTGEKISDEQLAGLNMVSQLPDAVDEMRKWNYIIMPQEVSARNSR